MLYNNIKYVVLVSIVCMVSSVSYSQNSDTTSSNYLNSLNDEYRAVDNMVFTGVPFLLVSSNPVSSALGNSNNATSPNVYDALGNSSKLVFANDKLGLNLTYFPWFSNLNLSSSMYFITSSGFLKFLDKHIATFALRYLNYGANDIYDEYGVSDEVKNNPIEIAFNVGYVYKVRENLSTGIKVSSIFSRPHSASSFYKLKQGQTYAVDLNLTYKLLLKRKQYIPRSTKYQFYNPGLNYLLIAAAINNLGDKIQYTDNDVQKNPLPTTIELGISYVKNITELNRFTINLDLKRMLVPIFPSDYEGQKELYESSIFSNIASSMGNGIVGTSFSLGFDYNYNGLLSFRTGYFNEIQSEQRGLSFASLGLGINIASVGLDLSYIIPVINPTQMNSFVNPIFNTFRMGLSYSMK